MTASEFKAWLEGYMLDRANPDAHVIAKKAQEVHADPPVVIPAPTATFRDWPLRLTNIPYWTSSAPTAMPPGISANSCN